MTRRSISSLGSAPLFAGLLALVLSGAHRPAAARKTPPVTPGGFGSLPLAFEPNVGQAGPAGATRFLAHGRGYELFLAPTEAVLAVGAGPDGAVHLRLVGANPQAAGSGEQVLPGKVSYLRGKDPQGWRRGIPTFGRVRLREVYPGVDLLYYGRGGQLEHDFVVAPGADPDQIRMEVAGAQEARLEADGSLVLTTPGGEITQRPPVAYQEIDGQRVRVPARFRVDNASPTPPHTRTPTRIGFDLAAYDRTKPLIIDPIIVWSTYLGAHSIIIRPPGSGITTEALTGYTEVDAITTDTAGSVYVSGRTTSLKFPVRNAIQPELSGLWDAFVTKYAPDGSEILYSTYLGGSAYDSASAIAVGPTGEICVAGGTSSADFPVANALQPARQGGSDGFVARLTADGSAFVYSTYLGGSGGDGITGLALTPDEDAWVVGAGSAAGFPLVNPLFPRPEVGGGFLARISADGSTLKYSTFLPGAGPRGIALDSGGNVLITGTAYSGLPVQNAVQPQPGDSFNEAFVMKLVPDGSALVFSTFLGAKGRDEGTAVAADPSGNVYVTGNSFLVSIPYSPADDFPVTLPVPRRAWNGNCFLVKLPPDGSHFLFSELFGGELEDQAEGLATDAAGRVFVTGWTTIGFPDDRTSFPQKDPLQDGFAGGFSDAFITEFDGNGAILFSSMVGGSYDDQSFGVAVDSDGNACIGGTTDSPDFPVKNALDPKRSGNASFVMKIGTGTVPKPGQLSLSATTLDFGSGPLNEPRTRELVLKNTGRGMLRVLPGSLAAPFSVASSDLITLAPGQSVPLEVTFTPVRLGRFKGKLPLTSNDPKHRSVQITLRGKAQS
jgi:hypothetical protein